MNILVFFTIAILGFSIRISALLFVSKFKSAPYCDCQVTF